MAVTDTFGQAINNSNNVASYGALSFSPAANDLLVHFVTISDTAATLNITDTQGLTYNKHVDQVWGTSHKMGCFSSRALAANSADTIAFTCTGDNGTGCCAALRRIAGGRATSDFVRQFGFATGAASTTPAVTLTNPINTNNAVLAFCCNLTNPAGVTEPTGFTEQQDIGHTAIDMGLEYANDMSGQTGSTITWGSTSASVWGAIVIEIYEASQPPKTPFFFREFIMDCERDFERERARLVRKLKKYYGPFWDQPDVILT